MDATFMGISIKHSSAVPEGHVMVVAPDQCGGLIVRPDGSLVEFVVKDGRPVLRAGLWFWS